MVTAIIVFSFLGVVGYVIKNVFDEYAEKYEANVDQLLLEIKATFGLKSKPTVHQLQFTNWKPIILFGKIENHITIVQVKQTEGENSHYFMDLQVKIPSSFYFELYRRTGGMNLLFGSTMIDFNDKAFSNAFLARTTDTKKLKLILDDYLRKKCLEAKKDFYGERLVVRNGKIRFNYSINILNKKRKEGLERMILLMLLIAKRLESLKA